MPPANRGEAVQAGTPLLRLVRMGRMALRPGMPSSDPTVSARRSPWRLGAHAFLRRPARRGFDLHPPEVASRPAASPVSRAAALLSWLLREVCLLYTSPSPR